jgi:bifunctional glutamyl/prolyl-tRNA synthetase
VDGAVKILLALKADYKKATGDDWKPGTVPPQPQNLEAASNMAGADSAAAQELKAKIDAQGNKVRDLKSGGGAKDQIDATVKVLLDLKAQYKVLTGEDLAGGGRQQKSKGGKEKENKKPEKKKEQEKKKDEASGDHEVKKVTRWVRLKG